MPKSEYAFLSKSHFGMDVLLQICCIFSGHLFLRTPLRGCVAVKFLSFLNFRASYVFLVKLKYILHKNNYENDQ